jgi:hypothetical protein
MDISTNELVVLGKLVKHLRDSMRGANLDIRSIERSSRRQFEIVIEGYHSIYGHRVEFSAGLKLWAIRYLTDWTSDPISRMTDYPNATAAHDWSGMRDSAPNIVDRIFREHVLTLFPQLDTTQLD